MSAVPSDAEWEWQQQEKWLAAYAFVRSCVRRAKLKRQCDCGHWVDGSVKGETGALYRYQVWKLNGDRELTQRTDCEWCARVDEGRA
jgi:hypothetical protein